MTARSPPAGGSASATTCVGELPATPEVLRQPDRHTRLRRHQYQVCAGRADFLEIPPEHRIHDRNRDPFATQRGEAFADCLGAARDRFVIDQTHPALDLTLQDAHEVRVGHRRQRVVPHAALVEWNVADEEMALEERCGGSREKRDRRS